MAPNIATKIKLLSWNCQSVRNKTTELRHYLESNNIDIEALSETWHSPNNQFKLQNVTHLYRTDSANDEHAVVAIAVRVAEVILISLNILA